MSFKSYISSCYRRWLELYRRVPAVPRDILVTAALLAGACWVSRILIGHTGPENNSALVFVLAVACISLLTTGYFYGIVASIVGTVCNNFFFMAPYSKFSLDYKGYPVTMLSMLAISCIVCALTARAKRQTAEATRREQQARELYKQNQKLNEEKTAIELASARETIRGNILRSVSHDLRTPLTSISGAASVLLSSPEISDKNVPLVQDIKSDADSLIAMVENLLSVTRIQDGTMPLREKEELLEEVAGDAVLTTKRRFPDCHVELELPEDILYLPMDSMLIKQVFMNLLENAVRHSGDKEHITLRLCRENDWAVAEVRDHGRGLPPEICRAIQENRPINRQDGGDSTRGMGIGLSACQSIIQAHGGYFRAGNHPEGGAVFRFGLPIREKDYE